MSGQFRFCLLADEDQAVVVPSRDANAKLDHSFYSEMLRSFFSYIKDFN